jgi:hypothetical protein
MLPILSAILGAGLGALHVRRRNGTGFDVAHYAAVWGVIGGVLGLFALILLARL